MAEGGSAFGTREYGVAFPALETGPSAGADVERINQYEFYELARKLGAIYEIPGNESADPQRVFWASWAAQTNATGLLNGKPTELGLSRGKAAALLEAVNGLIQRHFTSYDEAGAPQWKFPVEGAEPIAAWEWNNVRVALANFEMIFAEEMREAATYRVPSRGIYNTRKLVDDADCAFPAEIVSRVPEKTKGEWKAAGRCLAFGMFTACGFHVARAVEGMIEPYHAFYCPKAKARDRSWGHYIEDLEQATGTIPSARTLMELRQLKDDWRNPLMHPRVSLAEADARGVFNNGETLIMMMAQDMVADSALGAMQALTVIEGGAA